MNPDLPPALRAALDLALQGVPRGGLTARAQATSDAYRAGKPSSGVIREADDALAYALTRLPATYAACAAVFDRIADRAPAFAPASILDAGAGTAAASWAATEAWPGLRAATWLDANPSFLALAMQLAAEGPGPLRGAAVLRGDLTAGTTWPKSDLVVASYALAEIAPAQQAGVVQALWAASAGLLALVEPGTPAGYRRILAARDQLIAAGAALVAPCPHAAACPLVGEDWCHFSVRLPRSRDHRLAKGGEVPFEDERFAYLVAARPSVRLGEPQARVLAPPTVAKPGIALKLCAPAGDLAQTLTGKRDKQAYAIARRLRWGDRLPT